MIRIDSIWLATEPMDMRAGTETALTRVIAVFGAAKPHYGIYLRATIAQRGESELRTWAQERVQPHPSYGKPYAELPWSRFEEANGDLLSNPMMLAMTLPNTFDAMCFFMPEVVYEKLMERLREVAGRRWGASTSCRAPSAA
jgi:hypothetical protein